MQKLKKSISVCDKCSHPIVSTYMFSGAEVYCPSCGAVGDLFFGHSVEASVELLNEQKRIEEKFKEAREHIQSGGGRLRDCKKCKDEAHQYHLTKKEQVLHKKGVAMLNAMKCY